MKTLINFLTVIFFLTIGVSGLNAAIIHSMPTGGNWHETTTWQEGVVPGPTDDVVIVGGSTVIVYNAGHECHNLTLENSAVLQNRTYSNQTLLVHGNISNYGSIQNNTSYSLTINLEGNFDNYGLVNNFRIKFTGNSGHEVYCDAGDVFECTYFEAADTTGNLSLLNNIEFIGTVIDLNGVEIIGNTYAVKLSGGSYVQETTIHDFTVQGKFIFRSSVFFEGEIIVQDTLYKPLNSNLNLYIDGNLTNNGVITKPNYNFNIYITGNIVNNGQWLCNAVHFTGTGLQNVSLGSGKVFDCTYWIDDDSGSAIEALTDLSFTGTNIDLNGSTLTLPNGGHTLSLSDGYIKDGEVNFNYGTLFMENDAYIGSDLLLDNVTLEGVVQLRNNGIEFSGDIINNAFLRNYVNSNISTTITGNITNNDTITDPNYNFYLNVTGNITNNGVWSINRTNLTGSGNHTISQGASDIFSGNYFNAADTTGNITALSDITFEGTNIDLNGRTLTMPATKGSLLSLSGGYIQDGEVNFNYGTLFMENDAYIGSDLLLDNVTLEGVIQLRNNGIEFSGEIINNAFLRNYVNSNVSTTITGNITNNDTVTDPNYTFTLNVTGNIINNGIWSISHTNLTSTGPHTLSLGSGKLFSGNYFEAEAGTGLITATNDIVFLGTDVDLNGSEMAMPDEKRFSILGTSTNNAHLDDGTLSGDNFEFEGNDYSDFENITFSGNVTLFGNVRAVASADTFLGDVDVRDTLSTRTNTNSTLTIEGRLINNGAIINSNYHLFLNCHGHLVNNGTWTNSQTTLNGTEDQLIYLVSQKPIDGYVSFDAVNGSNPFQWYLEDTVLNSLDFTGETSQILNWQVPVSDTYSGDFYCIGSGDTSRTIVVKSGIIVDPKIYLQGPYNGTDMNTDLSDLGLIPLNQPFNMSPWNYNGSETAPSIPSDVVDWVLVELRQTSGGPETATSGTIVMQRALLLRNDGVAIDPYNFTPELKYDIQVTGNIYLVIWQRNHLGVMSAVSIGGLSPARYDFTTSASQAYGGTDALIDLGNGVFGMMGGDADYSQTITDQDLDGFWEPNAGKPTNYDAADFTLDGQLDNKDKDQTWAKTLGKQTQVPN